MQRMRLGWFLSVAVLSFCFGCIGEATPRPDQAHPKNFTECVAAGGRVLKSFPAQCVSGDGMRFIDDERLSPGNTGLGRSGRACKDLCGNGRCEEIVCMAVGCPCAETKGSCPEDCKE